MFTQFFNDWNEAVKNEKIIKTQYTDKGEVNWQRGIITFRGVEIQTHRKADGRGNYHVELFVPKTNKFISNKRFPTKAKCAEAIIIALLPGNEKEEIRSQRAERRAAALRKKITGERIESLRKLNMKKDDFAWFCELMNRNLQVGNSFYDDVLVDVLTEFHEDLCCDKSVLDKLPERDRPRHMERLYELAALICRKAVHARDGGHILLQQAAARLFRTVPDPAFKLPVGVIEAKAVFRNIDTFLHNDTKKLTYICGVLQDFYKVKTDKTADQILAAAEERKKRAKERKLRQLEGLNNNGTYTVFGEVQPAHQEQKPHVQKSNPVKPQKQNHPAKQKKAQLSSDSILDDRPGMVSLNNLITDQLANLNLSEVVPQDTAE
nr:MAG TPA: hypothetical protein [Bacteriophage sp.]